MRVLLLFISYQFFISNAISQHAQYQIEVNKHRTGSFFVSTEYDQYIHTFTTLKFERLALSDTLKSQTKVHFIESYEGELESISWTNVLSDTSNFEATFKKDSILLLNLSDSSWRIVSDTNRIIGPNKIRMKSQAQLDTIGSNFCFYTYSTELKQVVEVKRELIGNIIREAKKLKVILETIGDQSFQHLFNDEFYLEESTYSSGKNEIKISRTKQVSPAQFFDSDINSKSHLLSNIRFPDPINITSIHVRVKGLDSANIKKALHENQTLIDSDSVVARFSIQSTSEVTNLSNLNDMEVPEIVWNAKNATRIVKSLNLDSLSSTEKIGKIKSYLKSEGIHSNFALYQLALQAKIPARLVYGYTYKQWFWSPGIWVELAINGYWITQDLQTKLPSNNALKIALQKSFSGEEMYSMFMKQPPVLSAIHVESFELNRKNQSISNQILPYYFEAPSYENEGLGIRFNVPDGFNIINDGTMYRSPLFLELENKFQEKIRFYQFIKSSEFRKSEKGKILQFLNDNTIEIQKDKKLNSLHGIKGNLAALSIPQGKSFLFITINHEDPEFILHLLQNNLTLKY